MTGQPETICAVATPAGRGGISIIRLSGQKSLSAAEIILGFTPTPRHAHYCPFHNTLGDVMDTGIALYFPAPDSFTGEDVIEFQAHGGPYVMDMLLQELLSLDIRLADPGEFSQRAFLNDKIDLAQAEAIADLIDSNSEEAARFALRSLQGEFSALINDMVQSIIHLRMYVEAAIDFPEEEVDFLGTGEVENKLSGIRNQLNDVLLKARQGTIMKDGLTVVIAGEPNAGKSSLLNVLAGQSRAIVTDIAGTTRDTLREHISIDGMPLHIIDTAGLHESEDEVEQEGIRRAWEAIREGDLVLLLIDSSNSFNVQTSSLYQELNKEMDDPGNLFLVFNKIDLLDTKPGQTETIRPHQTFHISVKDQEGLDLLKEAMKKHAGLSTTVEGGFIARRRHLDALNKASDFLLAAASQLENNKAGELVAEDLREAHMALESITGQFTPDDLLGEIFTSFCIGK